MADDDVAVAAPPKPPDDGPAPPKKERKAPAMMQMRPTTLIVLVLSGAIIGVWLFLGFKILDGALTDPGVLENIEGLLAALAIFTIPAIKIMDKLFDKWMDGGD